MNSCFDNHDSYAQSDLETLFKEDKHGLPQPVWKCYEIPSEGLQQNGIFAGSWRAKEVKIFTIFLSESWEYFKFAPDKQFYSLLIFIN